MKPLYSIVAVLSALTSFTAFAGTADSLMGTWSGSTSNSGITLSYTAKFEANQFTSTLHCVLPDATLDSSVTVKVSYTDTSFTILESKDGNPTTSPSGTDCTASVTAGVINYQISGNQLTVTSQDDPTNTTLFTRQ